MSASAGFLRSAIKSASRSGPSVRPPRKLISANDYTPASPEIVSLARQAFLLGEDTARQRVLFLGADNLTNSSGLAEQVARALAGMQKTVSLVERSADRGDCSAPKKPPLSVRNVEYWSGFQVAENFWRIPPSALGTASFRANGNALGSLPFECVVLASSIGDAIAPLFFQICDAAVLVLTAHKTRKDAALRAKQVLEQFKVNLIGTVLDNRTFPIPEAIYKRL